MPTPECWQELGELRAEVDSLQRYIETNEARIKILEADRVRLKTIIGVIAFLFTGIGVFFGDVIKKFILTLLR